MFRNCHTRTKEDQSLQNGFSCAQFMILPEGESGDQTELQGYELQEIRLGCVGRNGCTKTRHDLFIP